MTSIEILKQKLSYVRSSDHQLSGNKYCRTSLKMRNNKSSVFCPRTMNLKKIVVGAVLRNIFNGTYVVMKSLEHDLEYKLLFSGLSLDLLYRP